jgi:hypothetical protein
MFPERSNAMSNVAQQTGSEKTAIRPFHVNVPEADLTELGLQAWLAGNLR